MRAESGRATHALLPQWQTSHSVLVPLYPGPSSYVHLVLARITANGRRTRHMRHISALLSASFSALLSASFSPVTTKSAGPLLLGAFRFRLAGLPATERGGRCGSATVRRRRARVPRKTGRFSLLGHISVTLADRAAKRCAQAKIAANSRRAPPSPDHSVTANRFRL